MEFTYSESSRKEKVELYTTRESNGVSARISYPTSNPEWLHTNFLERNGKFIKTLVFKISKRDYEVSERCVLPENFMIHTLTRCPNLNTISIEQCVIKRSTTQARTESDEQFSLQCLTVGNCRIQTGVLEELSHLLSKIETLSINDVERISSEDVEPGSPIFEVNMPYTDLCLIWFNFFVPEDEFLYVKVLASSEEKHYYFRYDDCEDIGCCVEMSEEDYMKLEEHDRIYVCCQNKPTITFEHIMH